MTSQDPTPGVPNDVVQPETSNIAPSEPTIHAEPALVRPGRLYYLDWVRVLALLVVCVVHVSEPFLPEYVSGTFISSTQVASIVFLLWALVFPWNPMAVFFLVSGVASLFALNRRSPGQYVRERVFRLLVPFLVGSILITPYMAWLRDAVAPSWDWLPELADLGYSGWEYYYLFWTNHPVAGQSWLANSMASPILFWVLGLHLWFLPFLFLISLVGLPFLRWFQSIGAHGVVEFGARLASRRGGLILFAIPLVLLALIGGWLTSLTGAGVSPDPNEGATWYAYWVGWGPFLRHFGVFVLGAFLFCEERMLAGVRRDWPWLLAAGLIGMIPSVLGEAGLGLFKGDHVYLANAGNAVAGWCLSLVILAFSMRYLNHNSALLQYSLGIIVAFYVLHYPVIATLAYVLFGVWGWTANVYLQFVVVLAATVVITIAIIELIIRPIPPLRLLFGVSQKRIPTSA